MDGGNYIKEGRDSAKSICLIFSPNEEAVGTLAKSLKLFEVQYCQILTGIINGKHCFHLQLQQKVLHNRFIEQ